MQTYALIRIANAVTLGACGVWWTDIAGGRMCGRTSRQLSTSGGSAKVGAWALPCRTIKTRQPTRGYQTHHRGRTQYYICGRTVSPYSLSTPQASRPPVCRNNVDIPEQGYTFGGAQKPFNKESSRSTTHAGCYVRILNAQQRFIQVRKPRRANLSPLEYQRSFDRAVTSSRIRTSRSSTTKRERRLTIMSAPSGTSAASSSAARTSPRHTVVAPGPLHGSA